MTDKLSGKVALVTGGSRGLGRWICVALAERGATVVVNYANNLEDANQTVDLIRSKGGKALSIRADVTDESGVNALINEVAEHCEGTVDILVNNAVGQQPRLPVEECTWDIYMDQLTFSVKAPLLLTKAVLPGMKNKQAGRIINIGSEAVQLGAPNFSNYVTAKSAMVGMTRSWASEFGSYGITVNLVAPGFILVERHKGMDLDKRIEEYVKRVPLGHQGEPSDIGNSVAFLASEDAKFITGQCLSVNGGIAFDL